MRKKLLLTSAVLGIAAMMTASAQVYSVNVVGYVTVDLASGFNLVANPLNNTTGNDLDTIMPNSEFGATVYRFVNGSFETSTYLGSWSPNLTLAPGEGFFVNVTTPAQVVFVGEVPQGAASNMQVPAGFALLGSKVPQAVSLDAAGFPAEFGDTVYLFRNGGYEASTYLGSFTPEAVPAVGEGFWSSKANAANWDRNFQVQ